jgi:hypothetical protein
MSKIESMTLSKQEMTSSLKTIHIIIENNRDIAESLLFLLLPATSILITLLGGAELWLKYEFISSLAIVAICFLCPKWAIELTANNVTVTNYHLFLTSILGCYIIISNLGPLFLRRSPDESVHYGHFLSKLVVNSFFFYY